MSFEILNNLFPDDIPDVSVFFSHDPQHGFTTSVVFEITGLSNYRKAYNKFVEEHWLPNRLVIPADKDLSLTVGPVTIKVEEEKEEDKDPVVDTKEVATTKPVVTLKK